MMTRAENTRLVAPTGATNIVEKPPRFLKVDDDATLPPALGYMDLHAPLDERRHSPSAVKTFIFILLLFSQREPGACRALLHLVVVIVMAGCSYCYYCCCCCCCCCCCGYCCSCFGDNLSPPSLLLLAGMLLLAGTLAAPLASPSPSAASVGGRWRVLRRRLWW